MKKVNNEAVVASTGSVSISCVYSMLDQALCGGLVLIDLNREHAEGRARSFRHGMPYAASPARIYVDDYGDCSDAGIVCICAGLPQRLGETRLDLVGNSLRVSHSTVTAVMASDLDEVFLVTINPVDVLSYTTQRFSGLPKERAIGSGTIIGSARFRSCLDNEFNVAPWSVNAIMIGGHGDSMIAVWSTASISGVSVKRILGQKEGDKTWMGKIYSNVRNAAYEMIEVKGLTNHGIGMGLSRIFGVILHNQGMILPMSSLLEDGLGQENVYISVSTVVNRQGAVRIINLDLSDDEAEQLARSAELLKSYQRKVGDFMVAR